MLHIAQLWIDCQEKNMTGFTIKSTFAKQQLDYGTKHGYNQLILALDKDDPTKGEYITNMDLGAAINFLQRKVNKIVCLFIFLFEISIPIQSHPLSF